MGLKQSEYMKAWRKKNKEHLKKSRRERHLRDAYGITQKEWDALLKKQGGVCALCQNPGRTGKYGVLAVDHCHETGRVRGLLCVSCNVSLGILGDTPGRIKKVFEYVCSPIGG